MYKIWISYYGVRISRFLIFIIFGPKRVKKKMNIISSHLVLKTIENSEAYF